MGYDDSTDDYKVVRSISYFDHEKDKAIYLTKIYSASTDSWKEIENLGTVGHPSKCINGKLHWCTTDLSNDGFFHNVVSLDLRDEKCGIMATPQHLWPFNVCYVSYPPLVEDLGGYLSLIIYTTTLEINVWVMMKYGDAESWTKIVRVGVQVQCHCG